MGMCFLRHNIFFFTALALLCGVSAFSCRAKAPSPAPIVRIRLESDPTTLDPAHIVDVAGGSIAAKIFSSLVRNIQDSGIEGDLCESFEVSPDGTRYTFHLKKGVRFHCGRELTSEDVRFSFERVLAADTTSPRRRVFDRLKGSGGFSAGSAARLEGIETPDPFTVVLVLDRPYAPFLAQLTVPTAHIVCSRCLSMHPEDKSKSLCGTGPYKMKDWIHDRTIELEKNDLYFGKKPQAQGICYYVVPEDFTAAAEMRAGRIDVMEVPASLIPSFLKDRSGAFRVVDGMTLSTYYLGMNCRKGLFAEKDFRCAVARAVDRDGLIRHLMENTVVKALGPIPPVLKSSLSEDLVPRDPEILRSRMSEADLPGDYKAKLFVSSSRQNVDIASAIAAELCSLGLPVEIETRDWSAFKDAVNKGEADLFFLSWWADIPDGIDFLYPTFHSSNEGAGGNRSFYSSPKVDALIEETMAIQEAGRRESLYKEISRLVVEESPWVFLWHKKAYYAVSKRMQRFHVLPMYNSDKGEDYALTDKDK